MLFETSQRRRAVIGVAIAAALMIASSLLIPLPNSAHESGGVRSIRVTDRHGVLLREIRPEGRGIPIGLNQIPAFVPHAVVAAEDGSFYSHPGVDPLAAMRAVSQYVHEGRIVSGASTITMQVARLLRGRTGNRWLNKMAEIHLALRLELRLSKEEILTLWLNRAYFGSQAYGVEAASRTYFGKSATDLAIAEAALLVGLAQSPSTYDPFRRPDLALRRRHYVLDAMATMGYLSQSEMGRLATLPLDLAERSPSFDAPHLVQRVTAGAFDMQTPPLEIRTTIDLSRQKEITALARAHLETLTEMHAENAAVLVVDNGSGDVLAYIGNADFWDESVAGQNDGVRMLRQPGSTLKPFTYGHALRARSYTAASILADVDTPVMEAGGAFSPENYDRRFHGPVPLRTALASSYNVPAVRLAREFGPDALLKTLHRAGFLSLDRPARKYGVGITLGNGEVSLEELAQAYSGLAGGGLAPSLRFEQFRRKTSGDTVRSKPVAQSIGFAEDVAFVLTDILSDHHAREPAFGRGGPLELPFPTAVKTGTSKNYRDNWAVGYTPKHTVAVWVGNFDGTPMRTVSGVSGAGTLLKSVFLSLGPGGEFEMPPSVTRAVVCPVSGRRPSHICPTRKKEVFLRGTEPREICSIHQQFTIDTRTGTLASADTPIESIATRVFEVQPPIFHEWMREQGIAFPPVADAARRYEISGDVHAAADGAPTGNESIGDAASMISSDASNPGTVNMRGNRLDVPEHGDDVRTPPSQELVISYPQSGMVYQVDAVLRREYQQFEPRGFAAAGLTQVAWWLDGRRLDQSFEEVRVPLVPGRHELRLRARDPSGNIVESGPTVFVVLGLEDYVDGAPKAPMQTISMK